MATAVLPPQGILTNPHHLYFYGSRPPPTGKRPIRSPPPPNKPLRSPPSNKKPTKSGSNRSSPTRKQQLKPALLPGRVTILKRGEDFNQLSAVRSTSDSSVLCSTSEIKSDSKLLPTKSESDLTVSFAGPVFVTSPPASDVPIPTFCRNSNKIVADGLRNLLKL